MEPWLDPLHDAAGMRAVDAWAIEDRGVPALDLMEAAGRAVAEAVAGLAPRGPVRVVCGKGNNGGDGLVAARHLAEAGYEVEALLLWPASDSSADSAANLARFPAAEVGADEVAGRLAGSGAIVDAVLGTGFSGAPREPAAAAIAAINSSDAPVVACDIPSGVDAATGEVAGAAVEARVTVSFHAAKIGQRIAPGKWRCGELVVAPIGIPDGAPTASAAGLITSRALALAPRRGARSTKFSSGRVVVVGASRGLTGAVRLCSLAAIRAGAGYATVAVPADLELVFELARPEVMSIGCPGEARLGPGSVEAALAALDGAAAAVVGPGLGRDPGSLDLVRALLAGAGAPLVLDADGLGAYAGGPEALAGRAPATILTPHAGELARLLGITSDEVGERRLGCAVDAAHAAGATVVLKGDDTIVTDGERIAVNDLPAPGLATAGTGDVLGGVIAALLARGLDPFAAACAGVHAHARAGREAARRLGAAESVVASDVIEALPAGLSPEA